jgi:hypothetical protein
MKEFRCCAGRDEVAVWLPEEHVVTVHGEIFACEDETQARRLIADHLRLLTVT